MHEIIAKMANNQTLQDNAIDSIIYLGNSTSYLQRQILAIMLATMSRIAAFRTKIKEMLVQLSRDRVVGVRVALAYSLGHCDRSKDWTL